MPVAKRVPFAWVCPSLVASNRHTPARYASSGQGSSPGDTFERSFTWQELVAEPRSEEHTSELQSQSNLVCRLLLENKKKLLSGYDQTVRIGTEPIRTQSD